MPPSAAYFRFTYFSSRQLQIYAAVRCDLRVYSYFSGQRVQAKHHKTSGFQFRLNAAEVSRVQVFSSVFVGSFYDPEPPEPCLISLERSYM